MKIKIKKIDSSIQLPEYKTSGAVGFDLSSTKDILIQSKTIELVPTGLIVCIPEDCMLILAARSSLPIKKGLMMPNGIGIIDQDYCGPEDELKLQIYNFTDEPIQVKKGDRLCQGVFVKIEKAEWEEVQKLPDKTRGGFGTTG